MEVINLRSALQTRAEYTAKRYAINPRKPIIIEFAGVPKAGKTTILNQIHTFLKRCGFRTEVVRERASLSPIRDKKHSNFNVWTACTTLSQILEKTQDPPLVDDPHILILDRGIFDSLCWLNLMEYTARIRHSDKTIIEEFLLLNDWRTKINAVIVMYAKDEDSMERERGYLPVEGITGSIMNPEMLKLISRVTLETAKRLKGRFRILEVDTSSREMKDKPKKTAAEVADYILNIIEEQLEEQILCLPKKEVKEIFKDQPYLNKMAAYGLNDAFRNKGEFKARNEIEDSVDFVQALPIIVVRNKKGDILQLRRKEKSADNPLHEKIVIWAGGHVRREDEDNGNPILQCILRESSEELRLSLEEKEVKLIGSIYADIGKRTSNHVAIVYEWRTDKEDVNVALCSAEFFERRGTSLSGKFINFDELSTQIADKEDAEVWSRILVRHLLNKEVDIQDKLSF